MSGEWLTLGDRPHKCVKPDEAKIELAKACIGALWQCSECGLVWELEGKVVCRTMGGTLSTMWTWTEFQQADQWKGLD